MSNASHTLFRWKFRHAVVTGIGVFLNLLVGVPLLLSPDWAMQQLGLIDVLDIWGRMVGMYLIIMAVLFIPMILDIDRFRIFGWLSILPARTFGAVFFLLAVIIYNAEDGFLVIGVIDAVIAIASLHCMIRMSGVEQAIFTERT